MNLNPVVLSIPIYIFLISLELIYILIKKSKSYYRFSDAVTNISCGIGDQLVGVFAKVVVTGIYQYVYQYYRIFDFEISPLYFIIVFIAVDFIYYWVHRLSHEVNFLWAGHVIHHQSEDYNLSVALRQSWFHKFFTFLFYLPLALIGFSTESFIVAFGFNLLYQFWIHTELIGKMGILEHVMNTPSHHRVHHGRNPEYIDKNHAGVFIIWDKIFGTFQEEKEKPVYGITTPVKSWNPLWLNVLPWLTILKEINSMNTMIDKLKIIFKPPGWRPESMGGTLVIPKVNRMNYLKFKTVNPRSLNLYITFQFIVTIIGAALFLNLHGKEGMFDLLTKVGIATLIFFAIANFGVMFDRKRWAYYLEYIRLIITLLFSSFLLKESVIFKEFLFIVSAITLISLIWLIIMGRTFKKR